MRLANLLRERAMPPSVGRRIYCSFAGLLLFMCGESWAGAALPAEQHAGTIRYRTGGVGDAESSAMKAVAPDYPLAMTFAVRIGSRDAYTAAVRVRITVADGAPVLDVVSGGPFLLVNLPEGKYRIDADCDGSSQSRAVEITRGGHRSLVFVWPTTDRQ